MSWSLSATAAITDIKKTILKKKVLLNIIVESYSWYDKAIKYVHMFLAITTPLVIYVDQILATEQTSTAAIVVSSIVAGMIKLKEYLKFTKMKDQAKQQTVKYQQLYQRIEKEMRKTDGKQNEEDFISWVNRELSIIEIDDPDVPQSLRKVFIAVCKEKGIPYDEDLDALSELFVNQANPVTTVIEQTTAPQIVYNIREEIQSVAYVNPTETPRAVEKENYKQQVADFNPTQDTSWALERLAEIDKSAEL